MKGWKKAVSAVIVLAVAAAAAGIAILKSLDFNQYRGLLAEQVKAATGRELRIAGNLQLELSLHPALAVDDVTFANAAWGTRPEMVKLKQLAAEVELLPLLTGDVRVRRLVLTGLDLLLETDAKGRGNWDLALAGAAPGGKPEKTPEGIGRLPIVNAVRMKDLAVTYRDGPTGGSTTLRLASLDARAEGLDAPMTVSLAGDFNGKAIEASGRFGPLASLMKSGVAYPVSLRARAFGADVTVEGVVGEPRELKGIDLRLEAKGGELTDALASVRGQVPALRGVTLPAIGPYRVAARVKGGGGALSLSAIEATAGREEQLRASVSGGIADVAKADGVDLKIAVDANDAGPLLRAFGVDVPQVPPLKLTAAVSNPSGAYVIDGLAASVGGSDLAGRLALRLPAGARPVIEARLGSSLLDIDALADVLAKKPAQPKGSGKKKERVFPADPLPVEAFEAADVRLQFKGKKVVIGGVAVEDVDVSLTLADGRLEVKPLAATVAGGRLSGGATIDGARPAPAIGVDLQARQVDYGALLRQLRLTDVASGKLDASIALKGRGRSVAAVMAGLDGRARVVTQGGRIESGLVNVLSADIVSALPFIDSKGDKDIRCGVVDFDVKKGRASARTLVFETGGLSMIGTGTVNLADETLALTLDPRAKKLSVLKLTLVPVNVGGTLAEPTVLPDVGGAAVGAVTGAVRTAKDIATGVAQGGVSALGGLVGLGDKQTPGGRTDVDDTDYCKLALKGGPVERAKPAAAGSPAAKAPAAAPSPPAQRQEGTTVDKIDKKLDELGKGLGGALKGLFGK